MPCICHDSPISQSHLPLQNQLHQPPLQHITPATIPRRDQHLLRISHRHRSRQFIHLIPHKQKGLSPCHQIPAHPIQVIPPLPPHPPHLTSHIKKIRHDIHLLHL